jgi:hypothetical protein
MATTTNFGWETPDDTDLVKDGAAAMRTLGNSIDTSFVDLKGGTTGQVLSKASNTDLDYAWIAADDSNAIQNAIVDAKGDLIGATAADTPARLAVGTNGQVLTADSTASTGLKWATPAGGGKVLQVVSVTKSDSFTAAAGVGNWSDVTGLSASITPSASTSKILVLYNVSASQQVGFNVCHAQMLRGSTAINIGDTAGSRVRSTSDPISAASALVGTTIAGSFLDSPATTSSTTYKFQVMANGGTVYVNRSQTDTDSVDYARTVSTFTLMEIGA